MIPLRYQILNFLQEPNTIKKLCNRLCNKVVNHDPIKVDKELQLLIEEGLVTRSFHNIGTSNEYILYSAKNKETYIECENCGKAITSIQDKLPICDSCDITTEDDYYGFGTSSVVVQHMQNIINNQKQQIYTQQQQIHILKDDNNSLKQTIKDLQNDNILQ